MPGSVIVSVRRLHGDGIAAQVELVLDFALVHLERNEFLRFACQENKPLVSRSLKVEPDADAISEAVWPAIDGCVAFAVETITSALLQILELITLDGAVNVLGVDKVPQADLSVTDYNLLDLSLERSESHNGLDAICFRVSTDV